MYLYDFNCKFQEWIMLVKTRDTDTVVAVQNAFENYFLALLKKSWY